MGGQADTSRLCNICWWSLNRTFCPARKLLEITVYKLPVQFSIIIPHRRHLKMKYFNCKTAGFHFILIRVVENLNKNVLFFIIFFSMLFISFLYPGNFPFCLFRYFSNIMRSLHIQMLERYAENRFGRILEVCFFFGSRCVCMVVSVVTSSE